MTDEALDRGDADDRRARLLAQGGEEGLDQGDFGGEVDRQDLGEVGRIHRVAESRAGDPGGVDQPADRAEGLHRLAHRGADRLGLGDVDPGVGRGYAGRGALLGDGLGPVAV